MRSNHALRTQDRTGGAAWRTVVLLALIFLVPGGVGAAEAAPEDPQSDGCFFTPSLGCEWGEHRLDLSLTTRLRAELWRAQSEHTDTFYAARTRVGLKYSYGNLLSVFGEFQDARLYNLSPKMSGAGALYRRFANGDNYTNGQHLRQLWLDVKPIEGLGIRIGRQDINLGTEVMYPEGNWKYVKIKRGSQRLVGTVGWTHAERSNDGIRVAYDTGGHHLFAFAAQPTTGVFDIDDAYKRQGDILYGGLTWTVKRDTWLPNTELRLFGLAYDDDRSVSGGGMPDPVTVYTAGASVIGLYPVGPGTFDVLAWGAFQFGEFDDLDHLAGAAILETGYQLTEVPWKPWFRVGVNYASGDGDPTDGDHDTFFNMLPTNHLYYGFADQWAFQNLVDWFAQLMLKPHEKVGINLMLHQFYLADDNDARYFGTGAFNKEIFGFGAEPSRGYGAGGTEIDAVVNYDVNKHLSIQGGYAYMLGRGIFNTSSYKDVNFGYLQLTLKY